MENKQQDWIEVYKDSAKHKGLTYPDNQEYSDFIVYVDESGDHSLKTIDPDYPVFVLAFCIFYKGNYIKNIVPALQDFKFKYFGHDLIVLHEHEIRKEKGDFTIFNSRKEKQAFISDLSGIINKNNFILVSCAIDKLQLSPKNLNFNNPYHLALNFCLEKLYELLVEKGQERKKTCIIVERRGKKEDAELELEFRRIRDNKNKFKIQYPFEIKIVDKKANSSGMQLADLVARPIGLHLIRPEQENRAFNLLKEKFYCEGGRRDVGIGYKDWGLMIYPKKN